jgi:hypothetical protein
MSVHVGPARSALIIDYAYSIVGAISLPLSPLLSTRLLLWDCDDRTYSYYIEVSNDQRNWVKVIDKSNESCVSWQLIRFKAMPITFIKIVGTRNTANEVSTDYSPV